MSAEVGIQKFSFPFSCSARQDEASQPGRIRVKASERRGLPENPVARPPSAVALVGILAGSGNPAGDAPDAPDEDESRAPRSAVLSRRSVFEKLAAEAEDQRPTAKRQLSTESASRSIAVVKKSAVRAEEPQRNLKAKAEVAPRGAAAATTAGRRRRRKDLFANSDIFHRLDSHVIRVGAEVTNARVTRAHFEGNTEKPQSPKLSGMRSNPGNNPLLLMFALQLREKRVHDVAAIVLNIASVAKSDLEKIRAIWVWLCHNIGEGKPVSAELGSISHFAVGTISHLGTSTRHCPHLQSTTSAATWDNRRSCARQRKSSRPVAESAAATRVSACKCAGNDFLRQPCSSMWWTPVEIEVTNSRTRTQETRREPVDLKSLAR